MWSLILMQWLHVFSGICWFGSILYLDFVVIPAVLTLPLEQQRSVSKALATFAKRVLIPAALLTIILGLVRGTIFGPVHSWSFLIGTAYGLTSLIASLAAVATFLRGHFAIGRAARRLEAFPLAEVMKSGGTVALAFAAHGSYALTFTAICDGKAPQVIVAFFQGITTIDSRREEKIALFSKMQRLK